MRRICLLVLACLIGFSSEARKREIQLSLYETSDVHGAFFPYDFIDRKPMAGSLARVANYVKRQRAERGNDRVVLLDNGDILQGQPSAYYYNFIDTTSTHLCAAIMNYMQYDAGTVGNHDVETGHAVYDRWVKDCQFPLLGANAVRTDNHAPYWKPYTLIEHQGLRIAVMGMITPGVPNWLPNDLWRGMTFEDIKATASRWMQVVREKEKADLVVGLFHSGMGKAEQKYPKADNAAQYVAREVPGFDIIFCGHDHREACRKVVNTAGDSVLIVNPGASALYLAAADVKVKLKGKKVEDVEVKGYLVDMHDVEPDADFCQTFQPQEKEVRDFTEKVIGHSTQTLETRPAFFGPSAFIDFIHSLQLSIGNADISFSAPLSFDAAIPAGDIRVSDMFNLYKYENLLYVMRLSGKEVKDYLEFSYANWTQQMQQADDHLLLFNPKTLHSPDAWQRLKHSSYNFDSAAGICYTVDVTKPAGQKITILSMADGKPFSLEAHYRVAVNSYRGNGGGGHLTQGAGIPKDQLSQRIVWTTEKDLRYYLMQEIIRLGQVNPQPLNQWRFIPEDWAKAASERDAQLLFK